MPDVINTFASLNTDAPNVWITKRTFMLSERNLAIGQFATEYTLPNYMSTSFRVNRYKRFNLPTQTLVEGVAPDGVQLVVDPIDVTVQQWGIVALLTDVSVLTLVHPVLTIAIERCALAISELVERELSKTLLTGTNVVYPTGATTRATITDGVANPNQRVSTDIILQCKVQLRARGAHPFEGGCYGGIMQPQHVGDLGNSDTTFIQAGTFSRVKTLEYNYVGKWEGVEWVEGNFLPIFVGVAAPDTGAVSLTKAQYALSASGGSLATATDYRIAVVAREITTDYERRFSQQTGDLSVTGPNGSIVVTTPSSTNYVYDVYLTVAGVDATMYKMASRIPASTAVVLGTVANTANTQLAIADIPASAVSVFPGWVIAKDAFARVKLNGMSMQSYVTPAGASYSNPLAQARKVGTKFMWNSAIQDNDFLVRFETSSRFGNYLAM